MTDDKKSKHVELSQEEREKLEKMAAENPGLMEYAHTAGGVPIEPTKEGAMKAEALKAMEEQTNSTMGILADFMQVAMKHAKDVQKRTEVSHEIYGAKMNFQPKIMHHYFLYRKADNTRILSMVGPEEWRGKSSPLGTCLAQVRLMADHTWELIERYVDEAPGGGDAENTHDTDATSSEE